jgi:NCS2 family nucleobase:cation symporter-2
VRRSATVELGLEHDQGQRIFGFMEKQGAAWGARPEVIRQAAMAINECYEIAIGARLLDGPLTVTARFDELDLDVELSYDGRPMLFTPTPPTRTEVVRDPSGAVRLASVVVQRLAQRVESRERDGHCRVSLHFEH